MSIAESKIAVVTGGNKGLGKDISVALAERGCIVAILSKESAANEQVVSDICSSGGSAVSFEVDLKNSDDIRKAFAGIYALYGRVDILVNNAGVSYFENAKDIDEQAVDDMIAVNLKAAHLACQLALPSMLGRKQGVIINISSIYGLRSDKKTSIYSMTKAGLVGYSKGLNSDYAADGIRVKVFCPAAFGPDCVLSSKAVSDTIVASALNAEDHYNEIAMLSKRFSFFGVLLYICRRWDALGRARPARYKFKIKR